MKTRRSFLIGALMLGVAGCNAGSADGTGMFAKSTKVAPLPPVKVTKLNVVVPRSLSVSEANSYHPQADIVWRGDPPGDRYAQIESIFRNGMGRGIQQFRTGRPIVVDITVERFHALTEKTRYTIGGIHSITFRMAERDASTGELLRPEHVVKADLKGFGGDEALAAERAGQTQRVRITDHLAQVIVQQLAPGRS